MYWDKDVYYLMAWLPTNITKLIKTILSWVMNKVGELAYPKYKHRSNEWEKYWTYTFLEEKVKETCLEFYNIPYYDTWIRISKAKDMCRLDKINERVR